MCVRKPLRARGGTRYVSPHEREEKQQSRLPAFRLHFRPLPLMQRVAGAKAIPDARRADGAPQQARTSPRPQAGEGSRRCPTRHAADGVQPNSRDKFRVPAQRGVRGCRGERVSFKKGNSLTAAGADVRAQAQGKTALFPQCAGSATSVQKGHGPSHPMPRAGQQPRCTKGHRLNTTRAF